MHLKSQKTIIMIVSVLLLVFIVPTYSFAGNYDRTYSFYVQYGYYGFSHKLYTSVQPSLYDYYYSQSHRLYSYSDYSKFVTPDAVKPIAECIQNITRNKSYSDEEFANTVLMLVRQVSYVKSGVKYPVEALVDNSGDCDVLSILAASIMKAGGLDVVLFYYEGLNPSHINVGVYLPQAPVYRTWWMTPACYEYNGKEYWMAECTSLREWKVGDRPSFLSGAKPRIISLENCEKSSPAHVSASLNSPLIPSSISITLSSENSSLGEKESALMISGSISPAYPREQVVMYVAQNEPKYNNFGTVFTDNLGNYSFTWNFTKTGTYYIRTSWDGFSNYAGSDSETLTVFRLSQPLGEVENSEYYGPDYALARANAAGYNNFVNQDTEEFLKSILSGTGVSLSGEFITFGNEQTITILKDEPQTMTIPAHEQRIYLGRGRGILTVIIPEQTITITVPTKQITNKYLGFILERNDGNNYSVTVRTLYDSDLSQMVSPVIGNNTTFMNASMGTEKNTWYNVVAKISEDEITAALYDKNSTLLKSVETKDNATRTVEFGILMACKTDTVVAFKNLKVETLDQSNRPVGEDYIPVNALEVLAPYIGLIILLAVAFTTVAYVKKRKRTRSVNHSLSFN